ncbi:isopenicillin N synthase family dioxygenase [Calothrix sp. PCC 6303]|uniref:isopenicillin N synthase family dioxygenase n=1 Tax=Calothrix sp. PCC 6303 TaxID=1170562 RepID=UPI0002A03220|nr:2OG-Fe(II) oxygenase family protein [Calothrix sp. PCC 6303]AFZ02499.1 2OG-Fe(II) oxygenase [Calothrix sp. PCC 6303]
MPKIQVIDFSLFTQGNVQDKQAVIQQIYEACHQTGFMYLQNIDICPKLINRVFEQNKSFFNLPLATKQQFAWNNELSNQGYVGIAKENLNPEQPGDFKEAFNITGFENGSIPSLFDASIPEFYQACTKLGNQILVAIALSLKLPLDFFTNHHNQDNHTMRSLCYPVPTNSSNNKLGAGEHSDYGSITLLFQDEISGLEIQETSGEWIAAPVIPGTVIVNTGDLMQRWTNDLFPSTKHRVVIPPDIQKPRYSIAFFCHPNYDTVILPLGVADAIASLPNCTKHKPAAYPPVLAGEYLLQRLKATY